MHYSTVLVVGMYGYWLDTWAVYPDIQYRKKVASMKFISYDEVVWC